MALHVSEHLPSTYAGGGPMFRGKSALARAIDYVAERSARNPAMHFRIYDSGERCRPCKGSGVGSRVFTPTTAWMSMGVWGRTERVACTHCGGTGRIGARGEVFTHHGTAT